MSILYSVKPGPFADFLFDDDRRNFLISETTIEPPKPDCGKRLLLAAGFLPELRVVLYVRAITLKLKIMVKAWRAI
jgi:hypothetical protein